jgi:hypothetical protein
MTHQVPDWMMDVLGPAWLVLTGGGMAFFLLSRNVLLKRRIWPIWMLCLWLFLVPALIGLRVSSASAAFALLGWGAMIYWNYRAWYFCVACGASSRLAILHKPRDVCPKCHVRQF